VKEYSITITDEQLSLLIRVLGKEKQRCNDGGFFATAHHVSNLQAHIKNNAKETSLAN
jgi:hypothetical protein